MVKSVNVWKQPKIDFADAAAGEELRIKGQANSNVGERGLTSYYGDESKQLGVDNTGSKGGQWSDIKKPGGCEHCGNKFIMENQKEIEAIMEEVHERNLSSHGSAKKRPVASRKDAD